MGASTQAVILAAGRGSRMAAETRSTPKALLPLGPRSLSDPVPTSFLRRHVEILGQAGVDQVVVVVGYLGERVTAALEDWGPSVQVVVNPTPVSDSSGSLRSFQLAAGSPLGVLDGRRQTLMMDADIVYHRSLLRLMLDAPEETSILVCAETAGDCEAVLVYGTRDRPRFLGKGLNQMLVDGEPCLGEAAGIVKLAPADHDLARQTMSWLLGDPDAPEDHPRRRGFGPARLATEHEELSQRLMHCGRMHCLVSDDDLPFMDVDTSDDYRHVVSTLYPRVLRMEAEESRR